MPFHMEQMSGWYRDNSMQAEIVKGTLVGALSTRSLSLLSFPFICCLCSSSITLAANHKYLACGSFQTCLAFFFFDKGKILCTRVEVCRYQQFRRWTDLQCDPVSAQITCKKLFKVHDSRIDWLAPPCVVIYLGIRAFVENTSKNRCDQSYSQNLLLQYLLRSLVQGQSTLSR